MKPNPDLKDRHPSDQRRQRDNSALSLARLGIRLLNVFIRGLLILDDHWRLKSSQAATITTVPAEKSKKALCFAQKSTFIVVAFSTYGKSSTIPEPEQPYLDA